MGVGSEVGTGAAVGVPAGATITSGGATCEDTGVIGRGVRVGVAVSCGSAIAAITPARKVPKVA